MHSEVCNCAGVELKCDQDLEMQSTWESTCFYIKNNSNNTVSQQ
jgi:hypothetical protein